MVSRFKLEDFDIPSFKAFTGRKYDFDYLLYCGEEVFADFSNSIEPRVSRYIKPNGHLDAGLLQGDWFPKIKADVFISHSRKDKDLAIALSGFLNEEFGLKAFVDSTIWHNVEKLQEEVDAPLLNPDTKTYNYKRRNQSTAYVHMLLSTALTKMIDNSEAIFFLSTNNSLNSIGQLTTSSAWIYHELFTANYLRLKYPERKRTVVKRMRGGRILEGRISDGFTMDFDVDLSMFHTLTFSNFKDWIKAVYKNFERHPLDVLYTLY